MRGERRADVLERLARPEPELVPDVDRDRVVADARRRHDPQARRLPDLRDVRRLDAVRRIDPAGEQVLRLRIRVVEDLEDDRLEVDVLLVVVVRRLRHRDVVLRHAFLEPVGAHADRALRKLRPELVELRRRHDHSGPIGELGDERRVRRLEMDDHRVGALRAHAGDRRDLARAPRPGQRQVTVERGLDRARVQRRAVVELDPLPEPDRDRQLVLGDLRQRSGELRDDLEMRVDVVELLADR